LTKLVSFVIITTLDNVNFVVWVNSSGSIEVKVLLKKRPIIHGRLVTWT